jgi:hypothetical protein
MRKHTKRVKYYRKKGSKKLLGGNPIARLLGFGRPAVNPNDAQAQQVAQAQADEVAGHQQMTESKQQQALALRNQCQDYQRRADQLDEVAAEHMRATAEIARNRESKNRCDQEQAMRLQEIEQEYQQRLAELTQQHNAALDEEKQRAQEEHAACLREGMRLVPRVQAMAQNPEAREATLDAAAAAIQARRRRQLDRRQAAEDALRAQYESAGVDPLDGLPVQGGRKSRRGGTGCGSHKKKMMYAGRKSRRGGTGCGSHKKKMMYAGRKSRRGGAHCSPKLKKNCPYYKKYGNHM